MMLVPTVNLTQVQHMQITHVVETQGQLKTNKIQDIINNLDIHVMRLLYPHGFV